MSYLSTYQRMEDNMIASIKRLEEERLAGIAQRNAAEGAQITIGEHVQAKAARFTQVDKAAECAFIKNHYDAINFRDMFLRLGQPLDTLAESTRAALKRHLTVREYAPLFTLPASPARA